MYLGGIEAGGTKFVCAVGDGQGNVLAKERIATTDTETTLRGVISFFKNFEIDGLGIGSFGPVDLNQESPTYGYITSTPKSGWANYPFVKTMEDELHVPVGLTTDVNAAALGELYNGAAKGLDGCLYITVGTGVGAGLVSQKRLLQGLLHPEMGHILLRRHPDDDFEGICPYHQDCLEGLASGPALEARWGRAAADLPKDHKAWKIEAEYLAQALMQYVLIVSPQRIIMGGGVMKQTQLFPPIRKRLQELLAGYIDLSEVKEKIDGYIVSPLLGDNAGITGALILAKRVAEGH
ncbi:ROK family protein [Sporolactobacillus shoreae]|uniref:fructokinase n=1 Tax=Sporolactobacillus shoreae TaxID=1465501 RepID=A0A4Z0GKN7_9BACL|nr:ROK family protein [Sporolactobacillus shoreae]TGA97510.1 ROK family protein [Sporolactobacillus shoreae]